jgi:hypothetical protein
LELLLDVNTELLPLEIGSTFAMALAPTLGKDGGDGGGEELADEFVRLPLDPTRCQSKSSFWRNSLVSYSKPDPSSTATLLLLLCVFPIPIGRLRNGLLRQTCY